MPVLEAGDLVQIKVAYDAEGNRDDRQRGPISKVIEVSTDEDGDEIATVRNTLNPTAPGATYTICSDYLAKLSSSEDAVNVENSPRS